MSTKTLGINSRNLRGSMKELWIKYKVPGLRDKSFGKGLRLLPMLWNKVGIRIKRLRECMKRGWNKKSKMYNFWLNNAFKLRSKKLSIVSPIISIFYKARIEWLNNNYKAKITKSHLFFLKMKCWKNNLDLRTIKVIKQDRIGNQRFNNYK